jgi:hypothetical protein
VPIVFGSTWNQDVFFQYGQYWTSSYYFGAGTLLLAMFAAGSARERRVWLLLAAAGTAFVLSLGDQTFVYRCLRRVLPQLTLMTYPVKFVTVIIFAGPLLAGFALAAMRRMQAEDKKRSERGLVLMGGLICLLIAAILFWARFASHPEEDFPATMRNGLVRAGFVAALVAALLLLGRNLSVRRQRVLSLGLLLVLWCDLRTHEPFQNPTVPPTVYLPGMVRAEHAMNPQPALGESRVMISPEADRVFDRVRVKDIERGYLARRLGYFSNCNLLDEVPKVNGFFSLCPREQSALNSWLYFSTNASFPHLEDFMSVSHVTSPAEFTKFDRRSTFLPEVTAGQKPVFLGPTNTVRRLFGTDFDGSKVVFLPPESEPLVHVTNRTSARVLSHQFGLSRVDAEVEAAGPAMVVISQTYYHRWRAYVDGQPAPLLRANFAFQAVEVPAGRHRVRVAYEDRAFQFGAAISAAALLGCIVGWVRGRNLRPLSSFSSVRWPFSL